MDGNTGMENGRHKDLEAMIYIDFWVSQLYSSGAIKDKVGEAHYKKISNNRKRHLDFHLDF